ncbi:hypothetical protein GQX74_010021 [Glossina fuscipes]|nr:hypothetical protein GQX74_010021 [Glossina fuscipes]
MAYLVLLPEPFHSEHKALDRKTLTGAVEFNVPAIEIYVSPPGVFITGPLLSCLLIVLFIAII